MKSANKIIIKLRFLFEPDELGATVVVFSSTINIRLLPYETLVVKLEVVLTLDVVVLVVVKLEVVLTLDVVVLVVVKLEVVLTLDVVV